MFNKAWRIGHRIRRHESAMQEVEDSAEQRQSRDMQRH